MRPQVKLNGSIFSNDPVLNRLKNKIMTERICNNIRFRAIRHRIFKKIIDAGLSLNTCQKQLLTMQIKDYLGNYGEVKD